MVDFYKKFLRSGDLVFDVGANIGNRVKIFLRLGCNVVAIEPQASCRSVLRRAFGRQIAVVPRALSDKIGSASMHISDVDVISSILRSGWEKPSRAVGFQHKAGREQRQFKQRRSMLFAKNTGSLRS